MSNVTAIDVNSFGMADSDSQAMNCYVSEKGIQSFPVAEEIVKDSIGEIRCSFFLDSQIFYIFENDILEQTVNPNTPQYNKIYLDENGNPVPFQGYFHNPIKAVSYFTVLNPTITFYLGDNYNQYNVKSNILAIFEGLDNIIAFMHKTEETIYFIKNPTFLEQTSLTRAFTNPADVPVGILSYSFIRPANEERYEQYVPSAGVLRGQVNQMGESPFDYHRMDTEKIAQAGEWEQKLVYNITVISAGDMPKIAFLTKHNQRLHSNGSGLLPNTNSYFLNRRYKVVNNVNLGEITFRGDTYRVGYEGTDSTDPVWNEYPPTGGSADINLDLVAAGLPSDYLSYLVNGSTTMHDIIDGIANAWRNRPVPPIDITQGFDRGAYGFPWNPTGKQKVFSIYNRNCALLWSYSGFENPDISTAIANLSTLPGHIDLEFTVDPPTDYRLGEVVYFQGKYNFALRNRMFSLTSQNKKRYTLTNNRMPALGGLVARSNPGTRRVIVDNSTTSSVGLGLLWHGERNAVYYANDNSVIGYVFAKAGQVFFDPNSKNSQMQGNVIEFSQSNWVGSQPNMHPNWSSIQNAVINPNGGNILEVGSILDKTFNNLTGMGTNSLGYTNVSWDKSLSEYHTDGVNNTSQYCNIGFEYRPGGDAYLEMLQGDAFESNYPTDGQQFKFAIYWPHIYGIPKPWNRVPNPRPILGAGNGFLGYNTLVPGWNTKWSEVPGFPGGPVRAQYGIGQGIDVGIQFSLYTDIWREPEYEDNESNNMLVSFQPENANLWLSNNSVIKTYNGQDILLRTDLFSDNQKVDLSDTEQPPNTIFFTETAEFRHEWLNEPYIRPSNIASNIVGIWGKDHSIYAIGQKAIEEFQISDASVNPLNFVKVESIYDYLQDWSGLGNKFNILYKNDSEYFLNGSNRVKRWVFGENSLFLPPTSIKGIPFTVLANYRDGIEYYLIDDKNRLFGASYEDFIWGITARRDVQNRFANGYGQIAECNVEKNGLFKVSFYRRNASNTLCDSISINTSRYDDEGINMSNVFHVLKNDVLVRSRRSGNNLVKFYKFGKIRNSKFTIQTNSYLNTIVLDESQMGQK